MWRSFGLMLSTFVLFTGCKPSTLSDSPDFGRFEGDIVASWSENGRDMVLRDQFTYVDRSNRQWTAPAGSVVNGASIPSGFWSLIGGPFEGKYRNASVVHDVGCTEMRQPWQDVHQMFYEACRCGGVDDYQAKMMYYAVYHFGPRWEPIVESVMEPRDNGNGQVVMQEVAVQRMARIDPPPPTTEEVVQVEAFVAEENPQPDAIRQFDRDQLHHRRRRGDENHNDMRTSSRDFANRWQGKQKSDRSHPHNPNPYQLQPDVQEAVIAEVKTHVEQQTGELRPAVYTVQPGRGVYRVTVQYVREDEQGQVVADAGGISTALVSRDGKLLEFVSGQ